MAVRDPNFWIPDPENEKSRDPGTEILFFDLDRDVTNKKVILTFFTVAYNLKAHK